MTTTHRHRAGQAIPDDGSCWRSLGERQNCTAATFQSSTLQATKPPLEHTGSAHLIGDGSDSTEAPQDRRFVRGLATGFVAALAVVGALVMVFA